MIYYVSPGNGVHCSLNDFLGCYSHYMLILLQSNVHLTFQVICCYDRVPGVGFELFHSPAYFLRRALTVSERVDIYIIY